jgi:hypothetical protein
MSVRTPPLPVVELYRVTYAYPGQWAAHTRGATGDVAESRYLFIAEGRCEGRINGRFRGANHIRRRADGVWLPDFRGVIETDTGVAVLTEYTALATDGPPGRRRVVGTAAHHSDDPDHAWLGRSLCLVAGEIDARTPPFTLRIYLADRLWDELAAAPGTGGDPGPDE